MGFLIHFIIEMGYLIHICNWAFQINLKKIKKFNKIIFSIILQFLGVLYNFFAIHQSIKYKTLNYIKQIKHLIILYSTIYLYISIFKMVLE